MSCNVKRHSANASGRGWWYTAFAHGDGRREKLFMKGGMKQADRLGRTPATMERGERIKKLGCVNLEEGLL
jgi:hypothetical protein